MLEFFNGKYYEVHGGLKWCGSDGCKSHPIYTFNVGVDVPTYSRGTWVLEVIPSWIEIVIYPGRTGMIHHVMSFWILRHNSLLSVCDVNTTGSRWKVDSWLQGSIWHRIWNNENYPSRYNVILNGYTPDSIPMVVQAVYSSLIDGQGYFCWPSWSSLSIACSERST